LLPDRAANLKAVRLRHQQIAEDHIGPMPERELDADLAVARFEDGPFISREEFAGRATCFVIILDQ
jgi:hypothetical protein